MPAYLIVTYDVSDPETYAKYSPGSMPIIIKTLMKHGGEVVVAEHGSKIISGDAHDMTVVLKFPNAEAAEAWHDDPEYAPAKALRLSSTTNIRAFISEGFVMPG